MDISHNTRVIDLQAPVRYTPDPRPSRVEFAVGTPRGQIEEAASLLLQASKLISSTIEEHPRYSTALTAEIARDAARLADALIAISNGGF